MGFAKMGLRFLNKRKLRTVLTIVAIMLGVGILTGVNVTADSIDKAINAQIYAKLGNNDIILRGNRSVDGGWFNYDGAKNLIEDTEGVETMVPRIIKSHPSFPVSNRTNGWNVLTIAIKATDPEENKFGTSNITSALDPSYENSSRIEDLLNEYSSFYLPVILSKRYADDFGVVPGDPFYILSENPSALGKTMDVYNTSTWLNGTVIGIIEDVSESVQDFMPPARIWELYPESRSVYIDLDDAWSKVFNSHSNEVNMIFLHVDNPAQTDFIRDELESIDSGEIISGGIFTENVKALFTDGISQVNFLMRGIFSIFSGISLLVCAIIIKNLLEMAKEEQTHEIGIMRAVGVTKSKILEMYISQIIFISLIGSLIGLVFGFFISNIFMGSYVDTASAVGTNFTDYTIKPTMSLSTVFIGIITGVSISLIFGFIPARSAANLDPLEALRSKTEKPKRSLLTRTIKKTSSLTIALSLTIGGIIAIGSVFGGLFILDIINPQIIIILFLGVISLIIGIVFLGAFFFPVIVPAISTAFIPLLRKMHIITGRNLRRNSRQTKNTFAMLAVGLCMMITVGTIMNSAYEGAYPGGKTITGGDISIGDFSGRGQIPINPHTEGLRNLPSIEQAVPIRFSLGFEGLTRIDRLENNETFGGNRDSLFGTVRESFHLGIIDPVEYGELHAKDSIVELAGRDQKLDSLMEELENPYTVILQNRLARSLGGLEEGEWVRLRFEGFEADFMVIGIFEILPGFYWSYYSTESTFDKQFAGAISWNTYAQLLDDNVGKADVIARNKIEPTEEYSQYLPNENLWGYASMPMDYQTLEDLALQTGLVQDLTRRVNSPFFAIPTFKWETNITKYDPNVNLSEYEASPADEEMQEELGEILNSTWALQDVLWHEDGSVNLDWNSMFSRTYVIDTDLDKGFGNTTIKNTMSEIPLELRYNIEDIFDWADINLPGVNVCIVNEIYVNYNYSNGKMDYVKKFNPGELVRMYYNDSIYTDFLVIATTNSHYPYEFTDEKGNIFGDTAVFNYEAMSFNTYTYNNSDWSYFFEVFDIEPNSIFLPKKAYNLPSSFTEEFIPQLIDQYLNNDTYGSGSEEEEFNLWWLNQTLNDMFFVNISSYGGDLNTSNWNATYSYDGTIFEFNGTTFTVNGVETSVNFTLNPINGTQLLEELADGNITLTLDNLTSSVIFDLDDDMTIEEIKEFISTMESICSVIPSLKNVTFFAPKIFMLEDSGLFNGYYLIGVENKDKIDSTILEIENYYITHDLGWEKSWVKKASEMEEQVGGILGLIVNMFFGVLSFALIASLLGLSISTIISVKRRYAEIGTLRTLGFSNGQILRMIIGEGVITAILGILVGMTAGLLVAYLIISNLPFMIFLPMIFAPPIDLILMGTGIMILASFAVSFLPAASATRIDIAEAIRTKGE